MECTSQFQRRNCSICTLPSETPLSPGAHNPPSDALTPRLSSSIAPLRPSVSLVSSSHPATTATRDHPTQQSQRRLRRPPHAHVFTALSVLLQRCQNIARFTSEFSARAKERASSATKNEDTFVLHQGNEGRFCKVYILKLCFQEHIREV